MELWQILGEMHPRLVSFPIVLLLCGLVFDLVGVIRRGHGGHWHWAGRVLTVAGTVFLLLAFICGIYAEVWAGRAGVPQHQIELHELMANVASWGFVVLMAWRVFLDGGNRRAMWAYVMVGLLYYPLLGLTGYLGGKLVFEYGAAVTGAVGKTVLTLDDLNTLATRQTDFNLKFSEWMHHIFGWMTLALGVSLFVQAVSKKGEKIKWVAPLLFLCGGVFLFYMADLDLYPNFFDLRQFRDREVQLHKTIALVMVIAGVVGLWRKGEEQGDRSKEQGVKTGGGNGRMVGVIALIGGGLLFTHVHTVAPYANVAAGVYIAHMVMGFVALSIGGARVLQDFYPRNRKALAIVFAVMMCVESVLLVTYNEGLPWYIGYGTYNRWGAHKSALAPNGGTVAPYGKVRAELVVDQKKGQVEVWVMDRYTEKPVAVPVDKPLTLLLSRGYEETAVGLDLVNDDVSRDGERSLTVASLNGPEELRVKREIFAASHFVGHADFLKTTPMFSARLALPVGTGGKMVMGYFDPWVMPQVVPVPENEVAAYQCPMHEGMRSEKAGECPLCGMELVKIDRRVRTELHDAGYEMGFGVDAREVEAGKEVGLTFTPRKDGVVVKELAVVHEHPLHLIVVSEDLFFFDHVHPVLQGDGSLTLAYAFPAAGSYLLFAECTPKGDRAQVFRIPVVVGKTKSERHEARFELAPSPGNAREIDGYHVEMVSQPRTLSAGVHANLIFTLSQDGRPVNDLEPYIGAMGHCVAISEDRATYVHSHPEMLFPVTKESRGGPMVAFHTMFPKAGRYKVWGQFKRGGKVIVADFVVDVKEPILPAGWMNFLLNEN